MPKSFLLALCSLFLALAACRTLHTPPSGERAGETFTPDTTTLPTFPAEALYVLGAQWEADTLLQQQYSIAEHIEQELLRLYPEKAYKGYINNLCKTVDRLLVSSAQRPTLFAPKQQEIRLAHGQSPSGTLYAILDSLSVDEELQVLELTPQEQADWQRLQALIHQPQPITREAFDTLNIDFFEEENLLLTVMLWRGPRLFYRILQSKARAEKMAYYYYGDATNNGRPGDAFKHIYVNVLLRTYAGEWLSHAIMDVFWEWHSPNAPCDHYMDLHNNIIGRQTRYEDFTAIDTQCNADMRHWLQWAENVQHFIQDSLNGDFQGWNKETPTFIVEPAAQQVSNLQYIYWDK